jgi:hypothetical protein
LWVEDKAFPLRGLAYLHAMGAQRHTPLAPQMPTPLALTFPGWSVFDLA